MKRVEKKTFLPVGSGVLKTFRERKEEIDNVAQNKTCAYFQDLCSTNLGLTILLLSIFIFIFSKKVDQFQQKTAIFHQALHVSIKGMRCKST